MMLENNNNLGSGFMNTQKIKDFLKEEDGLAAVEYAVLMGVVVAGVLAAAPWVYDSSNDDAEAIFNKIVKLFKGVALEINAP